EAVLVFLAPGYLARRRGGGGGGGGAGLGCAPRVWRGARARGARGGGGGPRGGGGGPARPPARAAGAGRGAPPPPPPRPAGGAPLPDSGGTGWSIVPASGGTPRTTARYSFRTWRSANAAARRRVPSGSSPNTSTPDAPRSSLWTGWTRRPIWSRSRLMQVSRS